MNQTLERLHDIEKKGYQIDFGNIFNHAFENYKKIALYAGLVLFIFCVLLSIFTSISLVSILGAETMRKEFSPENFKIENISEFNLLIIQCISLILSCLLSPFFASFYKMADRGDRDQEFLVSNLFSYYKFPYLKEIIISTLLISIINLSQVFFMRYIKFDGLGTIISIFISFITFLTIPLIIFGKLKAIEAIQYSIIIIFKNPFVLLGLLIVAIIGAAVGIMGCCIGFFFTWPFIYSMIYAIYSAILGIETPVENEYKTI